MKCRYTGACFFHFSSVLCVWKFSSYKVGRNTKNKRTGLEIRSQKVIGPQCLGHIPNTMRIIFKKLTMYLSGLFWLEVTISYLKLRERKRERGRGGGGRHVKPGGRGFTPDLLKFLPISLLFFSPCAALSFSNFNGFSPCNSKRERPQISPLSIE